jgi:hypothetical protein
LLAKHDNFAMERARHSQMVGECEAEEKKLLATTDLADAGQFKTVSDLRLKRELLPYKIRQFEDAAEEVLDELSGECERVVKALQEHISEARQNCFNFLIEFLDLAFIGRPTDLHANALRVLGETNFALAVAPFERHFKNDGFIAKPLILKAKSLIEDAPKILAITALCAAPTTFPWEIKTMAQLEEEEIVRLTSVLGREERIQILMEKGNQSRGEAEKTMDKRVEYLKGEKAKREGSNAAAKQETTENENEN